MSEKGEYARHRRNGTLEEYYEKRGGRKRRKLSTFMTAQEVRAKEKTYYGPKMRAAQKAYVDRKKAENPGGFRDRQNEANRKFRLENPAAAVWKSMQVGAQERGIPVEITRDDVEQMIAPMVCTATGVALTWGSPNDPFRPSIDRRDNSGGYMADNVRIVCTMYNLAKNRWTEADVLAMARALVEREDGWLR